MLKKLRKKFVMITVALVGIVMFSVSAALCVNVYQNQMNEVDKTLSRALESKRINFFSIPDLNQDNNNLNNDNNDDSFKFSPTVTVLIDYDGSIIKTYQNSLALSDSDLLNVASKALNKSATSGALKSDDLYYMKQITSDGVKIAFTDSTYFENAIRKTVIASILLFVASLFVVFLISLFLSSMALKPVKLAWKQQQQFIADASHELKTPLTVILTNTNILMSHKETTVGEQSKWIESTKEEAAHMGHLVNDLLFLAKSDEEKTKVVLSEINLSDICQNALLQFEPVAFERRLSLNASIDPEIKIKGDNTQLNQLIHIFLDNACKYTEAEGHIFMHLSKAGNDIKLSVSNTGKPIPAEDLPHVFERFYRSDKSRTKENLSESGGYGLGLSIAKTISEKHGGTISVESSEEKGTVFTVIFKNV